jgi:hypothetical protein
MKAPMQVELEERIAEEKKNCGRSVIKAIATPIVTAAAAIASVKLGPEVVPYIVGAVGTLATLKFGYDAIKHCGNSINLREDLIQTKRRLQADTRREYLSFR